MIDLIECIYDKALVAVLLSLEFRSAGNWPRIARLTSLRAEMVLPRGREGVHGLVSLPASALVAS